MKEFMQNIKAIGVCRAVSCATVGKYYECKGKFAEVKAKVKSVVTQWDVEAEDEENIK